MAQQAASRTAQCPPQSSRTGPKFSIAKNLSGLDRLELSFDLLKAPFDTFDERGELRLRERRRLPFLTVSKGSHQVSLVVQEPFSGFLCHSFS